MEPLPAMHVFYDELLQVQLDLPLGWQVGLTDEFPLLLIAPPITDSPAQLGVAQSVLHPPTDARFESLIAATKADQPRVFADYQHIYEMRLLIDRKPAYLQRFDWHPDGMSVAYANITSIVWAGGSLLFDIHATAQHPDHAQYMPIFEHIIKSLVFHHVT